MSQDREQIRCRMVALYVRAREIYACAMADRGGVSEEEFEEICQLGDEIERLESECKSSREDVRARIASALCVDV